MENVNQKRLFIASCLALLVMDTLDLRWKILVSLLSASLVCQFKE